jgi:plastocyanin domain-containing protein
MIEHLDLIYVAPMILAFIGRLLWWMFLSEPEDSLFPDEKIHDVQGILMILTLWPLIVFGLVVVAIIYIAGWPIWYFMKSIRAWRINRRASIQNVSGVIYGRQQNREPVLVSRVQVSKLDTVATRDSSRMVD